MKAVNEYAVTGQVEAVEQSNILPILLAHFLSAGPALRSCSYAVTAAEWHEHHELGHHKVDSDLLKGKKFCSRRSASLQSLFLASSGAHHTVTDRPLSCNGVERPVARTRGYA